MHQDLQRDRWLAWLLLACAAALLGLVVQDFGSSLPSLPRAERPGTPPPRLPSTRQLPGSFDAARLPSLGVPTNQWNVFYTEHFRPPPVRPPTTRQVELTYLGYMQAGDGPKQAVIRVGDRNLVCGLGSNVVASLQVGEISLRTLTLTNASNETNRLEFNVKKPVEVPL